MNVQELNKYYLDGIIIQREWAWKFFQITTEENIDEHITILREADLLEMLIENMERYPKTPEQWENVISVKSYCGPLSPDELAKERKKEDSQERKIVTLLREKLKIIG